MNTNTVNECTMLSDEEKITFPDVVARLASEGIEMYYADLLASSKTYYKGSEAYVVPSISKYEKNVGDVFDGDKIAAALKLIQAGQIQYQEFKKRMLEAGAVSYFVFIKGRKAIYFGKHGEQYVELFPAKK